MVEYNVRRAQGSTRHGEAGSAEFPPSVPCSPLGVGAPRLRGGAAPRCGGVGAGRAAAPPGHRQPDPGHGGGRGSLRQRAGRAGGETGFGPFGLLRERIERGKAKAEVFFSASLEHAARLEQAGRTVAPAVVFVRNRLCLLVRPGLTVAASAILDTLLDPAIRLGTSTPRADPSGDYAWRCLREPRHSVPARSCSG